MAWWIDEDGSFNHSAVFSTPSPWQRLETSLKTALEKSPESEELLEIKVSFGEIKTEFVRLRNERQKKGTPTVVESPKLTVDANGTQWGGFGLKPPKIGDPEVHAKFEGKPLPKTHHAIDLEQRYQDLEMLYQNLDREFRKCSDAVIDMNGRLRQLEGYDIPERMRRFEACAVRLELLVGAQSVRACMTKSDLTPRIWGTGHYAESCAPDHPKDCKCCEFVE